MTLLYKNKTFKNKSSLHLPKSKRKCLWIIRNLMHYSKLKSMNTVKLLKVKKHKFKCWKIDWKIYQEVMIKLLKNINNLLMSSIDQIINSNQKMLFCNKPSKSLKLSLKSITNKLKKLSWKQDKSKLKISSEYMPVNIFIEYQIEF